MKIINCPLNGPRNASEFIYGGEVCVEPGQDAGAGDWSGFLFLEENRFGVVNEWWCHAPTSYWFVVTRDTTDDSIIATASPQEFFQDRAASDHEQ